MSADRTDTLYETDLHHLELLHRGKVRDIYAAGLHDLLIVTCDRLSAFDVVLPDPIPGKGAVLNSMSNFWFDQTAHIIANHRTELSVDHVVGDHPDLERLRSRSVVVRKLKPIPVEAIVRGYLAGSGWKEYQEHGSICGQPLRAGLEQAEELHEPLFTPSTKAEQGDHDENISLRELGLRIGEPLAEKIRRVSLELYRFAAEYASERGIIIADTKFEFGLDEAGNLVLMDEVLTPDSSRFWPRDQYRKGISPPSYDKQFVRDYLETLDWDKTAPGPRLPTDIIARTAAKYQEAYERLSSAEIAAVGGRS